jgi:hypothetical protein
LISDFLFGIENPEYEVKQKNDGGWLVRRRRKKSLFSKNPKIEKEAKPKEEKEEAPPEKPKRSFDDISLDEIAEKLLEKINTLRKKHKEEEEKEEEDVDEKLIHGIEEEKNEPIQEKEPIAPPPTENDEVPQASQYFRRRSVRLY